MTITFKRAAALLLSFAVALTAFAATATAKEGEAAIEILGGRDGVSLQLTEYIDTYEDYTIYPQDNFEDVTWTVADKSVLRLNNNTGEIRPVAPGVTTVTATTDTGLTDTVTVTVKEASVWKLDTATPLVLRGEDHVQLFAFTPATDGEYTLYSEGEGDPFVELYNSKLKRLQKADDERDFNFLLPMTLTAGETYYFHISAYEPTITTVTLKQGIDTTLTAFEFSAPTVTMCVGDVFYPRFTYAPITVPFDGATATAADETVVKWTAYGFEAQNVGTTTLTATAQGGLTATMTVTVIDQPTMTVQAPVTVTLANGIMMREYTLRVDKTATYALQSFDEAAVDVILRDAEGLTLKQTSAKNGGFLIKTELQAGITYRVFVMGASPDQQATFEMAVTKVDAALKPTAVAIAFENDWIVKQEGDEVWVTPGVEFYPNVVFSGVYGAMAEKYTVSVGDESVLYDPWGFGNLTCVGLGDTTLTVETAGGLSHTYTIHVINLFYGDTDRNGVIDIADAVRVFRSVNGRMLPPNSEKALFDVTEDNNIDIADAVMLFRYANGRITTLG